MPGNFDPIPEVQVGAVAYLFGINPTTGQPLSLTFLVGGIGGASAFVNGGNAANPGGGTPAGANAELDSDDVQFTWTEKENKDTTGNTQNITKTNFKYERTIKLFPSGATRAAAAAGCDAILTTDVLTVANYVVPSFNGNWRIRPGTKISLKMDDNAGIDISAEKYLNASQNAALTGPPIAG